MKTIKNYLLVLVIFLIWDGSAQNLSTNSSIDLKRKQNLPTEHIYVHSHSQNVFVGESFYYKVYVTTPQDKQLSNFSKIAYVRLIGQENSVVFNQKIKLKGGEGYGNYLIPSETPTGNYKLVVFTKMGLHQPKNNVFVTDISIINPYTSIDPKFVTVKEETSNHLNSELNVTNDSDIQILLTDSIFGKRKKVELKLKTESSDEFGMYSISITKQNHFSSTQKTDISNFDNYQKTVQIDDLINHFPELRGELISGIIKTSNKNASIKQQHISLSIPEENYVFKIGITDDEGRFFINIDEPYLSNNGFLQVLNEFADDYEFKINDEPIINASALTFQNLDLSKDLEDYIIERSVKNQIQNNYSSAKQNLPKPIDKSYFYGDNATEYNLDDFTRFPTLDETFTEIIKNVWFKRRDNGYEIRVRAVDDFLRSPFESLVLIDGIYVSDHTKLYEYSAYNIQNISVIRDKYYYGGKIFQGVISIETIEKDYINNNQPDHLQPIQLFTPEQEKSYYKVDYGQKDELDNIPDFRTTLLWEPMFRIEKLNTSLEFYTSDESGTYEIIIEGINKNGEPINAKQYFNVR